jgi:predicted Zn-dependent peptidase
MTKGKSDMVRAKMVRGMRLATLCLVVSTGGIVDGGPDQVYAEEKDPTSSMAASESPEGALLRLASQVKEAKLSNGIRVVIYPRGKAPVFSGALSVRVGGVDETVGKTGIAHMLEHMAFKGTSVIGSKDAEKEKKLLSRQEDLIEKRAREPLSLDEESELIRVHAEVKELGRGDQFAEEYGKRGSVGLNATTDKDLTQYFVSFPRSAFEFWCWLESERLVDPIFRQFYEERSVVLEERRMRTEDNPHGKLYEELLFKAFPTHPYRNPVIGYRKDIESLSARDIEAFHKQHYAPEKIAISIVGDVNLESDLPVLEKYFGRIPSRPVEKVEVPQPEKPLFESRVSISKGNSPDLFIAYHKPSYPHPDDPPLSLFEEIVAGSPVSPLIQELVKGRRVALGVSVFEAPGNLYPNLAIFGVTPRPPVGNEELLVHFDNVLATFIQKGPTPEQIATAKRAIAVEFLEQQRSNMSLAVGFSSATLLYGSWRAHLSWFEEVMKVTVDDLNRVARAYFTPQGRTVASLEPVQRKP